MAATSGTLPARASTETDSRHLLAESVSHSEASSVIDVEIVDGERTPRARSPVSASKATDTSTQGYKGFPSKAHYLAALNAWADSKRYLEPSDSTLPGYADPKIDVTYRHFAPASLHSNSRLANARTDTTARLPWRNTPRVHACILGSQAGNSKGERSGAPSAGP